MRYCRMKRSARQFLLQLRFDRNQFCRQVMLEFVEQLIVQFELLQPGSLVDCSDGGELLTGEFETGPFQVFKTRRDTKQMLFAANTYALQIVDTLQHPLQHAHVVTKARPDELALSIGAEPVDAVDFWQFGWRRGDFLADVEPMLEVVAHVVAGKWQHRKWITTHHTLLADGCSSGFRTHGSGHVDAFDPIARFGYQRHCGRTATAENECRNRHTGRIVPSGIKHGVLSRCDSKA